MIRHARDRPPAGQAGDYVCRFSDVDLVPGAVKSEQNVGLEFVAQPEPVCGAGKCDRRATVVPIDSHARTGEQDAIPVGQCRVSSQERFIGGANIRGRYHLSLGDETRACVPVEYIALEGAIRSQLARPPDSASGAFRPQNDRTRDEMIEWKTDNQVSAPACCAAPTV